MNLNTSQYPISKTYRLLAQGNIPEELDSNDSPEWYIEDPSRTVVYNLDTNTEGFGINNKLYRGINFQAILQPSIGLLEDNYSNNFTMLKNSYPFPPDDREKVSDTSIYPWRTICKLYITAKDGTQFIGTGFIINEFHVLTCGHCVYIHENGGWISELEVIPGMDGAYEPVGKTYATSFRTYTAWIESESDDHDWAMVTLDRNIGTLTGWMGIQTAGFTDSIYTGILHTAGYPGDLDNGNSMYYDSDNGAYADEYNHGYWMDTAGGQSGSPVWHYDGNDPYILTINAYGYENGTYPNYGTRINNNKYDDIVSWLNEDSSEAPIDKAELLDAGYYSNIIPTSIFSGETVFEIVCDVKNEGTATAPSFKVKYYASEDRSITSTDYLIGITTINDLDPFYYTEADWSGAFPSAIPDGHYYVGWIIDADNDIDELDENNNIVFDNSFQIEVITRETFNLMEFLYIPILLVIGVIVIVCAVSIILTKRKIPDLEIFFPLKKDIAKFCPKCGQKNIQQVQNFCAFCGYEFQKVK